MKLATLDFETDPFKYGQLIQPFAAGLLTPDSYGEIWNDDPVKCVDQLLAMIYALKEPHCIYAHNGGKFDFWWLLKALSGDIRIVNGRIIQANLGIHRVRDSFAIMPFALKQYKKTEIDYGKMTRDVRHLHRAEILSYLKDDNVYLLELVTAFHVEFGDKLTIGGASLSKLKTFHTFAQGSRTFDEKYRARFYFGGRNQVFKSGIIRGKFEIYDVNSMYPFAMKAYLHPVGTNVSVSKHVEEDTILVVTEGWNYGAFPTRTKTGLDFTVPYGTFHTTIHEYQAALETETFKERRLIKTYGCAERISFAPFVDHFFGEREDAILRGDKTSSMFYKWTLNSSYGKFAQNPDNYCDWKITPITERLDELCHLCGGKGKLRESAVLNDRKQPRRRAIGPNCSYCNGSGYEWSAAFIHEGQYIIWSKPCHETQARFNNVLTGTSITGAARAVLLRGIHSAKNPVYCDTDSIIAEGLTAAPFSDSKLGAWKIEGRGDMVAIAGKKTYAVLSHTEPPRDPVTGKQKHEQCSDGLWVTKKACKGARLSGDEIVAAARGAVIEYRNPVPCLLLDGNHSWTFRHIRRTA